MASTTSPELTWKGAELLRGDTVEAVRELKARPGNELQVHGSGNLVQTLAAHDLVDTYRLLVAPVVLGSGKRLFERRRRTQGVHAGRPLRDGQPACSC